MAPEVTPHPRKVSPLDIQRPGKEEGRPRTQAWGAAALNTTCVDSRRRSAAQMFSERRRRSSRRRLSSSAVNSCLQIRPNICFVRLEVADVGGAFVLGVRPMDSA